ncbi:hypothetical protein PMAYCL1PPCAC_02949 [Pristionchus mayeri]|uniref:Uncharacterized protein n=1 Tax=Pristionchus mayeri TaxID=1317129 RepID=A0AAN4Z3N5_9BILA|nr:hypothetical protein PMAYCL1PPCAC_02949 [Pristionchus mayeri]
MFVFYDCLWKSVTFTAFRILEYHSSFVVDIDVTKDQAFYSQSIHIVVALLFVISLLSRNTFVTVLTIVALICQSIFTYKHYASRECSSTEISFTGANACANTELYFETFNRELFSIYMVALAAVICILCLILYVNHLENCIENQRLAMILHDASDTQDGDHPKTSVVSVPSNWSGKREPIPLRSLRRDSGNYSV